MITPMQAKCLELKSKGLSIYEISLDLSISPRTVEYHLAEARERLEAKDTTHAVVLALKKGLISFMVCVCTINAIQMNYTMDMRPVRVVRTIRTGRKEI